MPFANPEKSFDVAVRHLFRHLGDTAALRRNPLVRDRFGKAGDAKTDAVCVAEIRNRILREAALCRSHDIAAGAGVHARRQYTIVEAVCLGEPAAQTIARLKLSRRQYYRDRQTICARVGRALVSRRDVQPQVTIDEPLELLLRRAAALVDQGFPQRAVSLLDQSWSGITLGESRFRSRIELAHALIAAGDVKRANRLLDYARNELQHGVKSGRESLDERLALAEARFAFATGHDGEAGPMLDALAKRHVSLRHGNALALETLVECGLRHCSNARFDRGRELLGKARSIASRLPDIAPHQNVAIALLHAYCAEDIVDEYDGSYRRFRDALALSIANASVRGSLEATIGLMGHYASVGVDDEMFDYAQRALVMARSTEGHQHLLFAVAWIGTTLMKTRYWRAVDPLIFEAEQFALPGTLHWVFIKEAQADFLARTASYQAARVSFAAARDAAITLQNPKWQAIVFRDLGLMLNRLGDETSIETMEHAVKLAESTAGAWSRSLTYRAASKVLTNRRLAKLAGASGLDTRVMEQCSDGAATPYRSQRSSSRLSLTGT